ncbi:MAG: NYN domain-containing protein, partial [Clostridiales bacterium]|nr:NYN domain-containing protein [Clostridiales bacterium]
MVNQKRIALFVDIDNMPLNKKHVDNIITQLEKSGEIVYAKIYGVTDRRHREIICDAVARGFETVPPVYPTRRGSTKVFDIRILVDLCELFATNKSIDGVAIVA